MINHGYDERDLWFETMVFGGPYDHYCMRYETYPEAQVGHGIIVNRLAQGYNLYENPVFDGHS